MSQDKIIVYTARAMSGRKKSLVVCESQRDYFFLHDVCGFTVLDPVQAEGVKATPGNLQASKKQMNSYWPRDKQMIRQAHVFMDMTPHLKSQGVEREGGYARYNLWKGVVRVFPRGQKPHPANVCYFEDDVIVDSLGEAAIEIQRRWGTRRKRIIWRFKMLNRCLLKWFKYQLLEWK